MKTVITDELLTAYLTGTLDQTGVARVEAWSDASPENRKALESFYYTLFIGERAAAARSVDVERSLAELKRRIRGKRRRTLGGRAPWISATAAVAVTLTLGAMWAGRVSDIFARPVVACTQLGERVQLILPDGSKVWLNSCSRLEYSSRLFPRERKVEMTGEAYFEVEGDRRSPFVVSSNGLDTRVHGTKFNIRANEDEGRVTATLLEGSIVVSSPKMASAAGVGMRPSQQLVFDIRTGRVQLTDTGRVAESIYWIDGRLHFQQAPLGEITRELERYYNVDITFADPKLADQRFSCDFETHDNIHHILSTLTLTDRFDYRASGNGIELYPTRK